MSIIPKRLNLDALEHWLIEQPREIAIAIAQRAAMRVFPLYAQATSKKYSTVMDITAFAALNCLLVSGVARKYLRDFDWAEQIFEAADRAAFHFSLVKGIADSRNLHSGLEVELGDASAISATCVTSPKFPYTAARAVVLYLEAFKQTKDSTYRSTRRDSVDGGWRQVRNDMRLLSFGNDLRRTPLWSDAPPDWFTAADAKTREIWATDPAPENWAFWTKWWDAAIAGKPLNWELQRDVALIPDEVWKAGPGEVAKAIVGIEAKYVFDRFIAANPFALKISYDVQTGKLVSQPSEPVSLESIISAIKRVLDEFNKRCKTDKSPNGLGQSMQIAVAPVLRGIRRDVKRYAAEPLYLFDALTDARVELAAIQSNEGFSGVALFDRLMVGLERNADDVCATSPAVLATERNRAAVQLERFSQNQLALAVEVSRGMQGDSTGLLYAASGLAIQVLTNPKSLADDRKAAWYFVTAVVPRGARAIIEQFDEERDAPALPKPSTVDRIAKIAGNAAKIDKGIDALQEAATEIPGWIGQASDLLNSIPLS